MLWQRRITSVRFFRVEHYFVQKKRREFRGVFLSSSLLTRGDGTAAAVDQPMLDNIPADR